MLLLKRDEEDDFDGVVRTPNHKCVEVKVPKEMVRLLIGRNGKNIKMIQEKSNTKINFRDLESDEKVVVCFFLMWLILKECLFICLGLCYSRYSRGLCCGARFSVQFHFESTCFGEC